MGVIALAVILIEIVDSCFTICRRFWFGFEQGLGCLRKASPTRHMPARSPIPVLGVAVELALVATAALSKNPSASSGLVPEFGLFPL